MDEQSYTSSLFNYIRTTTKKISVGNITIGGDSPIRVQSMTTTDTNDIQGSVDQSLRIVAAGGEIVRLTTQGEREAKSIGEIRKNLRAKGCTVPLVADVHFNPKAAEVAADLVEAVRINPGNYTGEAKKFRNNANELTDIEWHELIVRKLTPLVDICKEKHTAIRIGVNHGSLSDRVMAKYGDTPEGMVASCTEYLDAFEELNFSDIVISIKSSNTRVMVETVRLLAATMRLRGTIYPLHLGVTEAGSDAEGRIKSAAGIGALLADGLGDTIRVSLTEAPEAEIPVAKLLVKHIAELQGTEQIAPISTKFYSPYSYKKRDSLPSPIIGTQPIVCVETCLEMPDDADWKADIETKQITTRNGQTLHIVDSSEDMRDGSIAIRLTLKTLTPLVADALKKMSNAVVIGECCTTNHVAELRALSLQLLNLGVRLPFIAHYTSSATDITTFQIEASADLGLLFIDGLADGILLSAPALDSNDVAKTGDLLLQATRARFSRTEFISCPGCGRTLYDIQQTVRIIKERLGHLKGLKIGVMGCIVNGIGEMADADYGYVGAGRGTISLYRGKEIVRRSIPQTNALDELIDIIKADGKWQDPIQK